MNDEKIGLWLRQT